MFQVNFRSTKLTLIYFLEKIFKILKSPESKIFKKKFFQTNFGDQKFIFLAFNDFRSAVKLNSN